MNKLSKMYYFLSLLILQFKLFRLKFVKKNNIFKKRCLIHNFKVLKMKSFLFFKKI